MTLGPVLVHGSGVGAHFKECCLSDYQGHHVLNHFKQQQLDLAG